MKFDKTKRTLLWAAILLTTTLCGPAQAENTFSDRPTWSSGTTESGGDGIARFIDFDRDGDLDFVTSAPNPNRWVLYRNMEGQLEAEPFWESNETSDCDHIDVVDFNGDGFMDLAATHESHCTLYFNKWGSFESKPDWETDIVTNANQIDFGDFDGDSDLDMVMASGEPINGVALFENTTGGKGWPGKGREAGTPDKEPTLKLGREGYSEAAIFADFDNDDDGKLDIIAHYASGQTVVYRNTGDGFDDGTVVFGDTENPWTQRHYYHDLNGDGEHTLFAAKGPWTDNGMSLQLAKQAGAASMHPIWKSPTDTMFHAFEFGDVDGDGDDDVVASDYAEGGRVFLYLNEDGKLSNEPALTLASTGPVHEAVLGDIDLDGDLDLAVGARDQAHIYENRTITTGYFSPANRARPMLDAKIIFQPSVFSPGNLSDKEAKKGQDDKESKDDEDEDDWEKEKEKGEWLAERSGSFPSCDFEDPDQARRLLGDYTIDVTYYSKDYEVVEKPTDLGRYGAVATITAKDGHEYTRYRTIYHSAKHPSALPMGTFSFPAAPDIDKKTWQRQQYAVNSYIGAAIGRDVRRSHEFAVLLAGIDEAGPDDDPESHLTNAVTKDRQWWVTLKRKLNGNAERFVEKVVAPVTVDGLDATVLRPGTDEEAGMKPGTAEKVLAVLEAWSEDTDVGFNVTVARNGVVFINEAYGSLEGKPVTTESKHVVASISKTMSGVLLMMFIDQGLISLGDPIEDFLPAFRREGVETPATFHHLFTHTADTDGHFLDMLNDLEQVYGEAYPYLRIGKELRYNGTGIALGLKAIEQITGTTTPVLYQEYLFGPLGCESIESIDGAVMTWSNAYDMAIVGQMLANRGAYGDQRFFSEETFEQMLPQKLDHLLGPDTEIVWGIGLTPYGGNGLSDKTVGHGSATSCTMRVDLENNLVITMSRGQAGKNFYEYHPKFIAAIAEGVAN
jgi:CubicO group peptidase (beta-lactamase class C family)